VFVASGVKTVVYRSAVIDGDSGDVVMITPVCTMLLKIVTHSLFAVNYCFMASYFCFNCIIPAASRRRGDIAMAVSYTYVRMSVTTLLFT